MLQNFLRMDFGTSRAEKRYRGMACRTNFRRISLDGVFRVLKVQDDSRVSSEAIRSFHWACFRELSDSWIPT